MVLRQMGRDTLESAMARAAAKTNTYVPTGAGLAVAARSLDEPLDTTVRIVTPERIVFQYPLAGPFHRALAYLIDRGFTLGLAFAGLMIAMAVTLGSPSGLGVFLVGFFVLDWGYTTSCEAFFNGRT